MKAPPLWWAFLRELVVKRQLVAALVRHDFRARYLGSYLGIAWAFTHPVVYVLLLWFIFRFAFSAGPVGEVPYVLWLTAGIVPWFFFADGAASAAMVLVENAFLVKKMSFSLGILPLVKILSSLRIHLVLLLVVGGLLTAAGRAPSLHWLQLGYYLCATVALLAGLSWLTSAATVFLRDLAQLVTLGLQFFFWATPIFWSIDLVPTHLQRLLKLNPLMYIVQGYRESLLGGGWFWEHRLQTAYFWAVVAALALSGAWVFRRLRPHFADVL